MHEFPFGFILSSVFHGCSSILTGTCRRARSTRSSPSRSPSKKGRGHMYYDGSYSLMFTPPRKTLNEDLEGACLPSQPPSQTCFLLQHCVSCCRRHTPPSWALWERRNGCVNDDVLYTGELRQLVRECEDLEAVPSPSAAARVSDLSPLLSQPGGRKRGVLLSPSRSPSPRSHVSNGETAHHCDTHAMQGLLTVAACLLLEFHGMHILTANQPARFTALQKRDMIVAH